MHLPALTNVTFLFLLCSELSVEPPCTESAPGAPPMPLRCPPVAPPGLETPEPPAVVTVAPAPPELATPCRAACSCLSFCPACSPVLLVVVFFHTSLTLTDSSSPKLISIFAENGVWNLDKSEPIVESLIALALLILPDLRGAWFGIMFGKCER